MGRWKVEDMEALHLIGHREGLTKKGTRPRFRVTGPQAELFSFLREIDAALESLGRDPADWIREPIKEAPFRGATPLTHISRQGLVGARNVVRKILAVGLRQPI
jgi:hypothetical protein